MEKLTFTNKSLTANFTYADGDFKLTGIVRSNEENNITAIEGGLIMKNEMVCGNFYVYFEGETKKVNLNNVNADDLGVIGMAVNDCILELKTSE